MSQLEPEKPGKPKPSDCIGCAYAQWFRTNGGRLSPHGGGLCLWRASPPERIPIVAISDGMIPGDFVNRYIDSFIINRRYSPMYGCETREPKV